MKKYSTFYLTLLSNSKFSVEDFFRILCPSQKVRPLILKEKKMPRNFVLELIWISAPYCTVGKLRKDVDQTIFFSFFLTNQLENQN